MSTRFTATGAGAGRLVLDALRKRGLVLEAEPVRDYEYVDPSIEAVPVPAVVRALILSSWVGVVQRCAARKGLGLHPVADDAYAHDGPAVLLASAFRESEVLSAIFRSDIQRFAVDVSRAPLEEIVAFRAEHRAALTRYLQDLREFAVLAASVHESEGRAGLLEGRAEVLVEEARALRRHARRQFGVDAAALGIAVSAFVAAAVDGNPVAALLGAGTVGVTAARAAVNHPAQYRYLIAAEERFRYDPWS